MFLANVKFSIITIWLTPYLYAMVSVYSGIPK